MPSEAISTLLYNRVFVKHSAEQQTQKVLPLYLYYGYCSWFSALGPNGMHDVGISWNPITFFSFRVGYMYCDYFYKNSAYFSALVEFGNWSVLKIKKKK